MSRKYNSSLTDEPILMILYAVYTPRIRMKEVNPRLIYFKGDNSSEIISSAGQGVSLVI